MAAQSYCTATTIKAKLSIGDAVDDTLLGTVASETNDWLEGKIGFPVGPTTSEERLFDGMHTTHGGRCLPVYPWGVRAITQLRYTGSTGGSYTNLSSSDYFIRPPSHMRRTDYPGFEIWLSDNGTLAAFPTTGYNVIGVTATWGWASIPAELSGIASRVGVAMYRRRSSGSAQFATAEGLADDVASEELSGSDWRTIWKYSGLKDLGAA